MEKNNKISGTMFFKKATGKEKALIFRFLKEQNITGIHLTLTKSGEYQFLKKYHKEGKKLLKYHQNMNIRGCIENISLDDTLAIRKIIYSRSKKKWQKEKETFHISIECVEEILIIK